MMSHHRLMLHPEADLGVNPNLYQGHPRWRRVAEAVEAA
uniref:Uncharacterized protein n=1 Tax=Rhizophora mucronata TaxID=61149 RepID=A0A2P2N1A9_RHIMU